MQIGHYTLTSPFVLAPMAGISDAPFRRICRHFGAGLTTSEMTTADISLWQTEKSRRRLDLDMDAEPRAVQIAGSDPLQMAQAAAACVSRGAQIIDINMGCPAKKVCRQAAGSALMKDPVLVRGILESVIAAVDVPVTLKIRTGWSPEYRNGVEIAHIAEDCGITSLVVHGRTRECRFKGRAEFATVAAIKSAVQIPVIANGDISSFSEAEKVFEQTSVDGIMIGRASRGRPWIFRELDFAWRGGRRPAPLDINEVRDIMLAHLGDLYRFYGDRTGVRVARKHLTWYCAGIKKAKKFRDKVVRVESASEQFRLTQNFLGQLAGEDLLAA